MDILQLLARDSNISSAYRRLIANPAKDYREIALDKAAPRRFTGEPLTGFGGIDEVGSDRWREVRDQEHADHVVDMQRTERGGL